MFFCKANGVCSTKFPGTAVLSDHIVHFLWLALKHLQLYMIAVLSLQCLQKVTTCKICIGVKKINWKKSHQKTQKKHFIVFVAAGRLGCHLSVIYSCYCTYSQQEKLMRQMGNRHRRSLIEINQTFGFKL